MTRLLRLCKIVFVILYYGLDELVLSGFKSRRIKLLVKVITIGRKLEQPRGVRLRMALTTLGPIFVKFGQVLSTRRDLMPPDIADELAMLQDQVPPFDPVLAVKIIEKSLGRPLSDLFENFEHTPVASASIAQVHFATLRGGPNHGREVAVKVLRPGMLPVIDSDLALMRDMATWLERVWVDGRRLKPREIDGYYTWQEKSTTYAVASLPELAKGEHEVSFVFQ